MIFLNLILFEIAKTINTNVTSILTIGIKIIVTIILISDKLPISSSGIDLVKSKIRHILIGISQIAMSVVISSLNYYILSVHLILSLRL